MKLSTFLSERKLKPSEFAEQIGVSASTITRLLNGQRRGSLDLVLKIELHTAGAVSPADFRDAVEAQPTPVPA